MLKTAIILLCICLSVPAIALAWPARVTVEPAQGGERVKVRLYGMDGLT
jgi:hypothetical protein